LARTKHIEDSSNPRFDETLFILLNNINNPLLFEVMDRNVGRADGTIGVANFDLKSLQESDNMAHGL
jgi:Ca2+-dependent lipid-binding protein